MSAADKNAYDAISPQLLAFPGFSVMSQNHTLDELSYESRVEAFFALVEKSSVHFDLPKFSDMRLPVEKMIIEHEDQATFIIFCKVWQSILRKHIAEDRLQKPLLLLKELISLAAAYLYFGAVDQARTILEDCICFYRDTKQSNGLIWIETKKLVLTCVNFQERLQNLIERHKRSNPPSNVVAKMLIEAQVLLVIAPYCTQLLMICASSLLRLKRFKDCCILLKEKGMVKTDPRLTLYYAQALDCCGLAEEANDLVKSFLDSVPGENSSFTELRRIINFGFLRSKAREALKRNDYRSVVSNLTRCIVLRNHYNEKELALMYFERGRANLLQKDFEPALKDLNRAFQLNPNDQHFWLQLQTAKSLNWIMIHARDIWLTTNSAQVSEKTLKRRNKRKKQKSKRQKRQKLNIDFPPEDSVNAEYFESARLQLLDEMQQAGYDGTSLPTVFGKSAKESSNEQKSCKKIQEKVQARERDQDQETDDDVLQTTAKLPIDPENAINVDTNESHAFENTLVSTKTEPEENVCGEVDGCPNISTKVAKVAEAPLYLQQDRSIMKFWRQRYQLFHRYDQGIEMDYESWYSVTPQAIAEHIAERVRCGTVVDLFAGCGGNTIQLAQTCHHVIAIEIDPLRIHKAKHNAQVYGVSDRIEWICGDALEVISRLQADVIFLSPPWGGLNYSRDVYSLKDMMINESCSGVDLFQLVSKVTENIVYYLPKTTSGDELEALVPKQSISCDQIFLNGHAKVLVAYFGDLVQS
uniref:Trimethylguanosine synthase n=1 Tax=Albugo laibachii Nc14 TaxID=890382 RepID=F0WTR9_9STRA|nr:trimethylguanosine synthase putative [Albugo laibachii Nc14]|eukprot:CCA24762.1 trimethylguanosine synthase putative [Albugo laibachii Nc14]